ncbi:MAG TPA: hypothetical protein VF189_04020 [Patescibacteria group bacterium]
MSLPLEQSVSGFQEEASKKSSTKAVRRSISQPIFGFFDTFLTTINKKLMTKSEILDTQALWRFGEKSPTSKNLPDRRPELFRVSPFMR